MSREFMNEVESEVERINAQFKGKNWKAILFFKNYIVFTASFLLREL
jgi:trehalose-6-phosphate synthase